MDCCKAEPLLLNDSSFADTCFVHLHGNNHIIFCHHFYGFRGQATE